jgi:hypothetical protein
MQNRAIRVLIDAVTRCKKGPLEPEAGIAFALAYLGNEHQGERWPFENFWTAIQQSDQFSRTAGLTASLNAIHVALKLIPPHSFEATSKTSMGFT